MPALAVLIRLREQQRARFAVRRVRNGSKADIAVPFIGVQFASLGYTLEKRTTGELFPSH
jgi:hypothetical protein